MKHALAHDLSHETAAPPRRAARGASPEERLVRRAQAGDREAFDELVRPYLPAAHRRARAILRARADADDACQDALFAAWLHLERYEPWRRFDSWFLRIVTNRAISLRRARSVRSYRRLGDGADEVDPPASPRACPLALAERAEIRARLAELLASLAEPHRAVLLMHDLYGYKHREIGARLGVAEGTSRHHLFDARRRMRARLTLEPDEG